jgi:hypothetical protein
MSRDRLQLIQSRRDQLTHRWMNPDAVHYHGVGKLPVHRVHQGMHRLVAADSEDRSTEDPLVMAACPVPMMMASNRFMCAPQRPDPSAGVCSRDKDSARVVTSQPNELPG